jgi:hypothetical protein
MATGDPDLRDTIIISMPHADDATIAEERERLLAQVHPGTAVVITRGVSQHEELRALAVRAFTLIEAQATGQVSMAWYSDRDRWLRRYCDYLESEHA